MKVAWFLSCDSKVWTESHCYTLRCLTLLQMVEVLSLCSYYWPGFLLVSGSVKFISMWLWTLHNALVSFWWNWCRQTALGSHFWFTDYIIINIWFPSQFSVSKIYCFMLIEEEKVYTVKVWSNKLGSFYIWQDDDQESVVMPNKNGENFLCFLPKVEKGKSGKPLTQYNTSSMIVETEKRIKLKTPDELLEALKGQCLIRVRICYLNTVLIVFHGWMILSKVT